MKRPFASTATSRSYNAVSNHISKTSNKSTNINWYATLEAENAVCRMHEGKQVLTIDRKYRQRHPKQQNVLRIRWFSSESIRPCAARSTRRHPNRRARARHRTRGNGPRGNGRRRHDGRSSSRPADEELRGSHVWRRRAKNGRRGGHDGRATRGWVSLLGVMRTSRGSVRY